MRNFFKLGAIMIAGLLGVSQTNAAITAKANQEIRATTAYKTMRERLPFVSPMPKGPGYGYGEPGLTPKQYGILFGNGGSKRSNRLRYSHNAKLKRRMAK